MNKWTNEEDCKLRELVNKGLLTEEIAKAMNRSFRSIVHRRADITRGEPKYTPVEAKIAPDKGKKEDVSKLIIQTLKDELANVQPFKASTQSKADIIGDTLVIHLTDHHAGKIVKDQEGAIIYNEGIYRERIYRLCEQTLKLLDNNISKGVKIKDVVIISTGDLANGEGIYATQAYEQEAAPPRQVMLVVDIITKLIVALLDRKLTVRFAGVRGNHGRTGKDTDVASNWDLMIYMILDFWAKMVLKNSNFSIKYTEAEQLRIEIKGWGYLLRHIAPENVDSPAGRVKINEWARQQNVQAVVYGHFHHAGINDCDDIRVFRGGSTVGGDGLSDNMAKHSEPIQLLWGVNEARVSTFNYLVDLNAKKGK